MKILKKVATSMILLMTLACLITTKAYGQSDEGCELIFYRPAQGMMSGGAAAELKIFINDQEVGSLPNGTVLNYTVFSQGTLKIKFVGIVMETTIGSPKVINIDAKPGETIAIEGSVTYPKGANAEILNAKKQAKFKKMKWEDIMQGRENIEKPFVEAK